MDGGARDIGTRQALAAGIGTMLRAREHDNALRAGLLQDLGQRGVLRFQGNGQHVLVYRFSRRGGRGNLDALRIVHQVGDGANGALVERGREQQRLPFFGRCGNDGADGRQKAHVKHAVGLIEHQHLNLIQGSRALLHKVYQAARGCDKHVAALLQGVALGVVAHTAHHGNRGMARMLGNGAAHLLYLLGKLAGGGYHQHEGAFAIALAAHATPVGMRKVVQRRQQERRRFACARLGGSQHIAASQNRRNRPSLNRGGRIVAKVGHRGHDLVAKA